jgi:hypothetical protein
MGTEAHGGEISGETRMREETKGVFFGYLVTITGKVPRTYLARSCGQLGTYRYFI